ASSRVAPRSRIADLAQDSVGDEGTFFPFEAHLSDQLRLELATEVAKCRLVNEDAILGSLACRSDLVLVQTLQPCGEIHRVADRRVLHPLGTAQTACYHWSSADADPHPGCRKILSSHTLVEPAQPRLHAKGAAHP